MDKILTLRTFYEKEAENELGKAVKVQTAIQNALEGIGFELVRISGQLSSADSDISASNLFSMHNYLKGLKIKKNILMEELVIAEENVKIKRGKYIQASKERQVLSRLKENKYNEWKKECLREEDNFLDDIASLVKRAL